MYARILTGAIQGVEASCVEVEVDCLGGLGQISVVGLPDASIKEAQERVRSAIKSCSFLMPPGKRWVVNLAPCDTRKEGSAYDLPIAVGILVATGIMPPEYLNDLWLVGELSLSGALRAVSGVLPIALAAKASGARGIVVPEGNAAEAALVEGLTVYPVSHLMQVYAMGQNIDNGTIYSASGVDGLALLPAESDDHKDFSEVKGQVAAKRALEIAACGRHNVLMVGPPGTGKSMLAERLPGILPPLEYEEIIELTKLFSVAGLLTDRSTVVTNRPFRSPHHSASIAGLIGGGLSPRPGEISLSHLGVLFLDELTEFRRSQLENLRQPLESRKVMISRYGQTLTYPASFMLVAACNPCPCGYRGDTLRHCVCTSAQAERYWGKISGPLMDRIDLQVDVGRLSDAEIQGRANTDTNADEPSQRIKARVLKAVERQKQRFASLFPDKPFAFNGQVTHVDGNPMFKLEHIGERVMARAINRFGLSARSYGRVLKLARTIADLDGSCDILSPHLAEALKYRVAGAQSCY